MRDYIRTGSAGGTANSSNVYRGIALDKDMKVLIVNDSSAKRRFIKGLLRDNGFTNTFEADDGHTALSMLKEEAYDFVVTMWNMPIMNGIEFFNEVRNTPELKSLPVLIVFEPEDKEHMAEATQAGAYVHLADPSAAGAFGVIG